MLELLAVAVLVAIAIQIKIYQRKAYPEPRHYFKFEEHELLSKTSNGNFGELYFYTVAEFSESVEICKDGIHKRLGFSEFVLIYDVKSEKFSEGSIEFFAVDGYDPGQYRGYYSSHTKGQIGIQVQLSLQEYDTFFADLRAASLERQRGKSTYFLYTLKTVHSIKTPKTLQLNAISEVKKTGVYDEYYGDKNSVMLALKAGMDSGDEITRSFCQNKFERFSSTLAGQHG